MGPKTLARSFRRRFTAEMFVGHEIMLDLDFAAAQTRLASLARGGSLDGASQGAYGDGLDSLIRVGPLGGVPGMSKQVLVQFRELVMHQDSAVLTLRWEATGAGGALFPVLDADMTLTPEGDRATRLTLAGAYRVPLGALGERLDRAILHRVATATIRSLLRRVADALCQPEGVPDTGNAFAAQPLPQPDGG